MHCDLIICNALTLGGTGTPPEPQAGRLVTRDGG